MPRLQIPSNFSPVPAHESPDSPGLPAVSLHNQAGHHFHVHPISDSVVRVVHQLPSRFPQKFSTDIPWEPSTSAFKHTRDTIKGTEALESAILKVVIEYRDEDSNLPSSPRLSWFSKIRNKEKRTGLTSCHDTQGSKAAVGDATSFLFLRDSKHRAYMFDASAGNVIHYIERELHLPTSEDEFPRSDSKNPYIHPDRNEFIYGLGETNGRMLKEFRKFDMQARDSLGYDWQHGDALYKITPFYLVYNRSGNLWHGIFYNSLVDSTFDFGSECDALFGSFRSFRANCGPLDYYVILGDGTLPSVISAYASLVTPLTSSGRWSASPTLPPLSQFGYLSSSLALAAEPKAQSSILDFIETSRIEGFPVDTLHLSSGWCQDEDTGDRNYFVWNRKRYPDPLALGTELESSISAAESSLDAVPRGDVKVIANIKPWLLDVHPLRPSAPNDMFIQNANDSTDESGEGMPEKSLLWSSGYGDHKTGSYIDFTSHSGRDWWKRMIRETLLANHITGMWIDNNEFSGLIDDEARYKGQDSPWHINDKDTLGPVERRMGWGGGISTVGRTGKAIQTMGMAKATFEVLMETHPDSRPVIVSRSGLPGIQAYAHGSWSGDNSTTWAALKWGTMMTLSVALSFGPGLYGHDIGGFAGKHSPSPELLVRWCQQGAWHTRFTVHSWKEISTTLWMYKDVEGITEILREVLAWRYRLAPSFYSFFVNHYHHNGWSVLKPMLWYHSIDPYTLALDSQFLFGSHVLVAPVLEKGAREKPVYLPAQSNDGENQIWWCELDTGIWHAPGESGAGQYVTLDAPLSRTPVLVRDGGILFLGGSCVNSIHDGKSERTMLIFPRPRSEVPNISCGSFVLIEDDGISNDHTVHGKFTEIEFYFRVVKNDADDEEAIEVDFSVRKNDYPLSYEWVRVSLPKGDSRRIFSAKGKTVRSVPNRRGDHSSLELFVGGPL